MKKLKCLCIGVFLMTLFSDGVAAAKEPEIFVLPNAMRVLAQEDERFPLVSIRLYVRAGSHMEVPDKAGISHLLEHMVFKGKGMAEGAAERIEGAGGYINAATSFDYTMYMVDLPADRWELGLDVLRSMIFDLEIDPEELEREKQVVISELKRGRDQPGRMLFQDMQEMVWKGTPYQRPIIGTEETLATISAKDIEEHIARLYQPQSMLLVVVGNVGADKVVSAARERFGGLENDRVLDLPGPVKPESSGDGPLMSLTTGPWQKAHAALAFPLPSLHAEESAALEVLAYLLGGDETSILYRELKYELNLVDEISVGAMTLDKVGMLYIKAVLDAGKVPMFWREINKRLSSLGEGSFGKQALERAKLNIEDSLYTSKQTLGGLASKLGYFQFFHESFRAEDNYLYDLEKVDVDQLVALSREHLWLGGMSSVFLVPESAKADLDLSAGALSETAKEIWPGDRIKSRTGQAEAGKTGEAEIVSVDGGGTLVLLPDSTLPYASLRIVYAGGDLLLEERQQGLAELAASTLTRGAGKLSATAYQEFLADRAASVSAGAGRDVFVLSASYPSRFEDDMLALLQKTIEEPSFAEEEVDRARDQQKAKITSREDSPLGLVFRNLNPFLFPGSRYGYLHLGGAEGLDALGRKDIESFWERQRGRPWVMAVCGSFDRGRVLDLARALPASAGDEQPEFPEPAWTDEKELGLSLPGREQAHLLAVFPVPGEENEATPRLKLLKEILSGQGGPLFEVLREERGLGYSVSAFLWQTSHAGFLAFYIGTSPEEMEASLQGFREVASRISGETVTDEQLERGKNRLKGSYYRSRQSFTSRAREAAGLKIRGFGLDYSEEVIERAQKVSAEELRQTAKKYVDLDRAYLVRLRP